MDHTQSVHPRKKRNQVCEETGLSFGAKFAEFCKRTDLHGLKYIVMEELSRVERCCWGFAVALSLTCAIYFVVTAYRWYARNPIVTVIESTQGAIWDVPFPAVTVCDLNKISRKAAQVFANNLTLPTNVTTEFIYKTLHLAPLLHSYGIAGIEAKKDLHKLQEVLDLNSITIQVFFQRLSSPPSCNDILQRCMWKNVIFRCEQLFQQIYMAFNICCTFNYYAVEKRDEKNISQLVSMPTPRRVASCGYQTALTVLLRINRPDYYSTGVASKGAVVFIDNAFNYPDLDSPFRFINPSTEVLIGLSPELTYTTQGIKSFHPEERQCYYHDEEQVGDFRQYSFHNCMAYRKVQIIQKACNCVPFYFPLQNRGLSHICNFYDMSCLENVLKPVEDNMRPLSGKGYMQCLPECEHYDYPLEVAVGNLATNMPLNGLPFYANVNLENRSILNVFFNDLVSTRYRRDVYLNWQNILAAFGGLLSLMLGFTLISGFDFLIFIAFKVNNESTKSKALDINKNGNKNKIQYQADVVQVGKKKEKKKHRTTYDGRSNRYEAPPKY